MKTDYQYDLPFLNNMTGKEDESEKVFEMFLPTLVMGMDAFGSHFQEKTELSRINSRKAVFTLRSRVTIGTALKLMLDIPKTLILENQLKLILTGKVDFVQLKSDSDGQQIIKIGLDKKYHIHPLP